MRAAMPVARVGSGWQVSVTLIVLALLHACWNLLGLGSETARLVVGDLAFALFPLTSAALAGHRAHRTRGRRDRAGWSLLAAGLLANGIGNSIWAYLELVAHAPTFPSAADACFVLTAPLVALGLILVSGPRLAPRERTDLLLDTGLVLIAGLLIAWAFLFPVYQAAPDQSLLVRVLAAYMPLTALLAFAAAAFAFLRRPQPGRERMLHPLLAGAGLYWGGQLLYSYTSLLGTYATGHWVDVLLISGLALFGVAALQEVEALPAGAPTRAHDRPWARLLPYLAIAPVYSLLFLLLHHEGAGSGLYIVSGGLLAITALVALRQVLTARENLAFQRRLAHQAFHDPLTGLPNRVLFQDRLEHALARAARRAPVAVLYLDLDRFKTINDSLGHEAGDALLVAVAERLQRCVRPEDTVTRLGGDEFAILLEGVRDSGDAVRVAERVGGALGAAFTVGDHQMFVSTSVGIAYTGHDGATTGDLLRDADIAMYRAKAAGKARYQIFDLSMNAAATARLELETALRRGLERGEFEVHYQPKVTLASGRITGLEALVRWRHPEQGLVPPLHFIPLAEETGLIVPLGRWVLAEACRHLRAWQERYPADPPLTICVNLSARQFLQPDLAEDVAAALRETGLPPTSLMLEITETVLMTDGIFAGGTLARLKGLGVQLAIDDFGTGYSSLAYLKRLPVDMLKIDKTFIAGLGQDAGDTAIVQSIVTLARTLGLAVTAEGVETAEELRQLRALGCGQGQGYYFAKPLPGAMLDTLLVGGTLPAGEQLALVG